MIHKAKDLSQDQRALVERLLGRPVSEEEAVSIRTLPAPSAPEWLQESWDSAERLGLDRISSDEIAAEIEATRKARRDRPEILPY